MNETIDRKTVALLMKELGIRSQPRVWSFIDEGGHYMSEVDELILKIKAEQDAEANRITITLNGDAIDFPVYGKPLIDENAISDMVAIARLPYVKQAAQMPDSHRVKENHVPVGGVVVTHDCILPGVVGNDIGCSVGGTYTGVAVDDDWWEKSNPSIEYILKNKTYFGLEMNTDDLTSDPDYQSALSFAHNIMEHRLLHHEESYALLKSAIGNMRTQFGTSGDGNHFIEIGEANVQPVPMGTRGFVVFGHGSKLRNLGILSHFGSRAIGSSIADFYLKKANEINPVPKGMEDNAPLFFGTDMWAEDYRNLMLAAGFFAEYGHRYIHRRIFEELAARGLIDYKFDKAQHVYTMHNFCFIEEAGFVHRKGATPAWSGHYANIPATMGDRSALVVGMGNKNYLESASHGAGRKMSRGQALRQGFENTADYVLREHGVRLIGGGADEDPRAYKVLTDVMKYQDESVKKIGSFTPKWCRMADPRFNWKRKKG